MPDPKTSELGSGVPVAYTIYESKLERIATALERIALSIESKA